MIIHIFIYINENIEIVLSNIKMIMKENFFISYA